jgi:hypothetical protein
MAATEDVAVIRIDAGEANVSVKELRDNLAAMKKQLDETKMTEDSYAQRVKNVAEQQRILKDVMWQQKEAADGVTKSYNSLSAQMARLKQEQKALNLSTEEGRKAWDDYAEQINAINDELKDLDATNGVYVRNVGDYANQFSKGFKQVAQDMPSFGAAIRGPIDDIGKSAHLLAANPVVGIATLLVPVINQIVAGLKENDAALSGIKKIMDSLQPVFNVLNNALEKAVGWVADMVSKLGDLAGESTGTFKSIVTGAVGVGNAILQFLLMPIRNVIDAAKGLGNVFANVFKGQFKEAANAAKEAVKDIGENIKQGFAFKTNFEAGQKIGEEFAEGMKSKKAKAAATAAVKEVVEESVAEGIKQADIDKALAEADRKADEARRKRAQERKEVDAMFAESDAALIADIEAMWDEDFSKQQENAKRQEDLMKQRVDAVRQAAGATSSILGSLADIYESSTDASEKETKKAKALRIAAATIDMLQGAVTAFSTAQSLGPIAGPIVGAANAAAVIAAGMANIAKIKNTQVNKNGASTPATASVPATVNAPVQEYTPPEQARTITSASEEDRLNRMADPTRVYILQSDIEAAGRASKVQVDESTF